MDICMRRSVHVHILNSERYVAYFSVDVYELSFQSVSVGLLHNLNAFVDYDGSGGATGEFDDISYWPNVMKSVNYVAQTLIGDGTLVSINIPQVTYWRNFYVDIGSYYRFTASILYLTRIGEQLSSRW